jgi:hypothetical protein
LIVIVPGLAVSSYVDDAIAELKRRGYEVELAPAPAWRGVPKRLLSYGHALGARLQRRARPVDLLVGLSVGSQAATIAALDSKLVGQLLLVSPMVDPSTRTPPKLLGAWVFRKQRGDPSFFEQVPDWSKAGIWRILAGFLSALDIQLERVLPHFTGRVTVVQPEWNTLSSPVYARRVAEAAGGRYLLLRNAAHSWPLNDPIRFAELVDHLLATAQTEEDQHGA